MVMTLRRGRGASKLRTGIFIKDVLSGKIPIEDAHTGRVSTVFEASPTDIHRAYKDTLREQNALRGAKVKPGVYSSFICQFRFAEQLKLVEMVREEPMISPPPTGHLYTIRGNGRFRAVISSRHIYRLTELGKQDDLSWTNLCQAYIQHWIAPQKLPEIVSIAAKYKFSVVPSKEQLIALMEHLRTMQSTKIDEKELDSLSMKVGDWVLYYEDRLKISVEKTRYQRLLDEANRLSERLVELDIQAAIDILVDMITHA